VQDVYVWHEVIGISADEIAHQNNLTLAQIYAALTFSYDHLDYIERCLEHDRLNGRSTPLPAQSDSDQPIDERARRGLLQQKKKRPKS